MPRTDADRGIEEVERGAQLARERVGQLGPVGLHLLRGHPGVKPGRDLGPGGRGDGGVPPEAVPPHPAGEGEVQLGEGVLLDELAEGAGEEVVVAEERSRV